MEQGHQRIFDLQDVIDLYSKIDQHFGKKFLKLTFKIKENYVAFVRSKPSLLEVLFVII